MKLLCFSDTHGVEKAILHIVENSKNADIVLCAGDLSDFGKNLEKHLKTLSECTCPVLIVNGNHEDEKEMRKVCEEYQDIHFIHKGSFEYKGYVFFGYGGLGFSKRDAGFESTAKQFVKSLGKDPKVILITHAPPYETKVDYMTGFNYVGNQSLKEFIKQVQPLLHVCGHIHESREKYDRVGRTVVINPGPIGKLIKV